MNLKAIEIQIYYEISMAIGTSLDLKKNLQYALSTYLRKLNCATGMVLKLDQAKESYRLSNCFCIPRNAASNIIYTSILDRIPTHFSCKELDAFINTLPLRGTVEENYHYSISNLPGFGFLLLIKNGQPLASNTLHSLRQINIKLADSCIACLQTAHVESMNHQLSYEIEQRKNAEKKLKELLTTLEYQVAARTIDLEKSKQRYKVLFDNIQDIYFSIDSNGIISEISPSVETTLLYSRTDLLGKSLEKVGFSRSDIQSLYRHMQDVSVLKDYSIQLQARDGVPHYFLMNAVLTEETDDDPVQIVGSLRDITRQKIAEESQIELEDQLLNSRKMEALGLLAGGVAHDLNNVLSGIVSYPDLLLTMLDEESELREPIHTIRAAGEKAAAIVQDLLTMARRGVPQTEIISLNSVIHEYLDSPEFSRLKESYENFSVITDLNDKLLNMEGSANQLRTAIMNLVQNGAESGANMVTITTDNCYLEGESSGQNEIHGGDYLLLTVTNNGIRLTTEDQQRIFEPFYTKKVLGQNGTGLGMPVVWGTIQDHKGYISINSQKVEGSSFQIYIPASRKLLTRKIDSFQIKEFRAKGETIMVVDDSYDQRHIARAILESLGYKVLTAESGEAALPMLKEPTPDLILLDMIMEGGMDGLDAYRQIRQHNKQQKVLIVSGYSETERVHEALRLGALSYIRKPYLLETIGKKIRQFLD